MMEAYVYWPTAKVAGVDPVESQLARLQPPYLIADGQQVKFSQSFTVGSE